MKRIRKGDIVLVVSGKDRGKSGAVLSVQDQYVLVDGIRTVTKHQKATKSEPGKKIKKFMPIHISNVSHADKEGKPSKVGFRMNEAGTKERYFKKSGVAV